MLIYQLDVVAVFQRPRMYERRRRQEFQSGRQWRI